MKKVAFYLENKEISSVDCRNVLNGNPGVGGTQHLIMVISYLLMLRNNGIVVKVYTQAEAKFPSDYVYDVVPDFQEAVQRAIGECCDYFVFRHDASLIVDHKLDDIRGIRLVVWEHVFVCYWELDYYAKHASVYQIINVGREMNDLYRDHKAYQKSSYIYNCVRTDGVKELVAGYPFSERKHIVTYIGSIVPFKGFHLLAEAWCEVLKQIPDAELYVIGSGKLYDRNSKLGEYNIAEASYEERFMKYLTKNGRILPGVHFMGVMGEEKEKILLQTKVGVPNPSGITETFCLSAVEMQLYGAKIATIRFPGYLDTVKNGVLYARKERKKLANIIVDLLNDNATDYENAMNFFEKHFSYDAVVNRWEQFFLTGYLPKDEKLLNPQYRMKWLKEVIRKIKLKIPFLYNILPEVERLLLFIERKWYGRTTYIDS